VILIVALVAAMMLRPGAAEGPPAVRPESGAGLDPAVLETVLASAEAVDADRSSPAVRLEHGLTLEANGLLEAARETYRRLTTMDPSSIDGWYRLAMLEHRLGDSAAAVEALGRCAALDPDAADVQARLAHWMLDLDATPATVAAAAERAETARRLDPSSTEADLALARAILAAGDDPARVDELLGPPDAPVARGPWGPYAAWLRAASLRARGRLDEAAALTASPGSFEAPWPDRFDAELAERRVGASSARRTAAALVEAGRWREAIERLRPLVDGPEPRPADLEMLGLCHLERGAFIDGLDAFERAVELAPDRFESRRNLAAAMVRARRAGAVDAAGGPIDLEVALEHARAAVALRPDAGRAHATLGEVLHGLGRLEAAVEALDRATELDRRVVGPAVRAGLVMLQLGRWSESEARLRPITEASDPPAMALIGLALALAEQGRFDEAEGLLERAETSSPAPGQLGRARERVDALRAKRGETG